MAKFTIFFKGKVIDTAFLESGNLHIGREESNDIQLNSLSVAPAHAAILSRNGECIVKQLNDQFPVLVNGDARRESALVDNDEITVGKYTLIYVNTETVSSTDSARNNAEAANDIFQTGNRPGLPNGNLQVLQGPNIGRIIPLKNALTRIGKKGSGIVAIARRKDGFYLSALEVNTAISVNNQPLGDAIICLQNDDILQMHDIKLAFYQH
ncbi:MAG: FHA domain-containing protein [Methylococcales bacterium]|nr:FHA domain-containing protein [Methylococcales bacterium]